MGDPEAPPRHLHHYTSPAGVLGILNGVAWATMVHYMNDASELQYALGLSREILLEELGDEYETRETLAVCEGYLHLLRQISVCAFCLSEDGDLLSQWRQYCPKDGGYAVAFDSGELQERVAEQGFKLVKCLYAKDEQLEILRPLLQELIERAQGLPPGAEGIDLHRRVPPSLAEVAARIKHPSFKAEGEWRLVGRRLEEVRYRPVGGLVVPYAEIKLTEGGSHAVASVRVGPHRNAEIAARAIRLLSSDTLGWPLDVYHSASPSRVL